MRARLPWIGFLLLAICGLAAWRAACVIAGPDIDTDAYAHHMIARAILADPRDLAVHWVWLPLFHYVQVPLVALGGTMQEVRWANVGLSAALPIVLFAYVLRTTRSSAGARRGTPMPAEATALLAALFSAMSPIVMQMGTTAQPEPLFALLILLVAIAFENRSYAAASLLLGAAVLLRYEAWAVLAIAASVLAFDLAFDPSHGRGGVSRWAIVALPVTLIVGWAALRRPVDGQWFGFLRQTHDFANDALHEKTLHRGAFALLKDALYYPLAVPVRVLGPAMLVAPFGVVRTVREQGARFVLVFAACLGFVSLTWAVHASLGLDRHFVCIVPLYATFAAQGIAAIAEGASRLASRFAGGARRFGAVAGAALALLSVGGLAIELNLWMADWRASIERGWPDRMALGAYLRGLPERSVIFCDDATLEILSGLDRRRFDRHWVDDPHTWDLVADAARRHGVAYVATWRRKLLGHDRGSAGWRDSPREESAQLAQTVGSSGVSGALVFRAGFEAPQEDTTGVAVMRVP